MTLLRCLAFASSHNRSPPPWQSQSSEINCSSLFSRRSSGPGPAYAGAAALRDTGVRRRAIIRLAIWCAPLKDWHVMWLDGQGVSAPWPSPFVPHVRRDARCIDGPPRGEAVDSFIYPSVQGVVCAAFLACIAGRWGRRASTVEIYSGEKVAECKLGAKFRRWPRTQ